MNVNNFNSEYWLISNPTAPPAQPPSTVPTTSSSSAMDVDSEPRVDDINKLSELLSKVMNVHSSDERELILEKHSLCNNIPNDLTYDVNIRLFAMLFGDKIIGSSNLEGSYVIDNVNYILKILSSKVVLPNSDKATVIEELKGLYSISNKLSNISNEEKASKLADTIQQKIMSLPENSRLLLPGGWQTTNGGHFILFEVIRNPNGFFDFKLYNTGAGTGYHSSYDFNEKKYINPIFSVIDIPTEKISSKSFLLLLIAINTKQFTAKGRNHISSQDIYEKLIPLLGNKFVTNDDAEWVTPQFSGTCSSKAVLAFLKNRFASNDFYELLYQLKFFCLANFLHSKKQCRNFSESDLIKKAAHGIANLGRKIYGRRFFSEGKMLPKEIDRLLELSVLCKKALEVAAEVVPQPTEKEKKAKISTSFNLKKVDSFISGIKSSNSSSSASSSAKTKSKPTNKTKEKVDLYLNPNHPPITPTEDIVLHFKEWFTYFKSAFKTIHDDIALHNTETMLEHLPMQIDFSTYNHKQKKQLFDTLVKFSLAYYHHSKSSNVLTVNANMWHLFYIMTQLWEDILSKEYPSLKINLYGINFLLPDIRTFRGNEPDVACKDLKIQEKNVLLYNSLKTWNSNKCYFLFDTLSSNQKNLSFTVTLNDYAKYEDFNFIKQFLESNNCTSNTSSSNFLVELVSNYKEMQKGGLPKSYYDLRQVYLFCCLSNQFDKSHRNYTKALTFKVPQLEEEELEYTSMQDSLDINITSHGSPHALSIYTDGNLSIYENWMPATNSLMVAGKFIDKIRSFASNQNQIRSVSRNRFISQTNKIPFEYDIFNVMFPTDKLNKEELTKDELLSISKYEINRISDILNAQRDKLYLALNYYIENPLLLEKTSHLRFLAYIFYQFDSLISTIKATPQIQALIKAFFNKLLTVYACPEKHQYPILGVLFSMGFDYQSINFDRELFQFLKLQVLKHYHASKKDTFATTHEIIFAKECQYNVFRVFGMDPNLTIVEAELALSLLLDCTTFENEVSWTEQTTPLLNKLVDLLRQQTARNNLLNNVPSIVENLDISLDNNWKQDDNNKFKFICQGWEFDLYKRNLIHPKYQKLDNILSMEIGGTEKNGFTSIKNALGKSYNTLRLNKGVWSNNEETIKLFKSNELYELHELLLNEWQQFSFVSEGLHKDILDLPPSFDSSFKINSTKNMSHQTGFVAVEKIIRWFTPISSSHETFYGKNSNDEIIYKLEKREGEWFLVNLKTNLIFGSIDNSTLPHSLEPILNFPLDFKKHMQLWLDQETNQIEKIEFPNFSFNNNLMVIEKKNGTYKLNEFDRLEVSDKPITSSFKTLPPFLQLTHANGKIAVMIPITYFSLEKKGVQNDPFRLKHICCDTFVRLEQNDNLKVDKPENLFYLYDLDEKSHELSTNDGTAQIYLSYLYFVDQNYEKAFQILKKCRQRTPYSQFQLALFSNFYFYFSHNSEKIKNPLQLAFLMHIQLFKFESQTFKNMDLSDCLTEGIEDYFSDYYQFIHAIPKQYHLTTDQVLFLLNCFECKENKRTSMFKNLPMWLPLGASDLEIKERKYDLFKKFFCNQLEDSHIGFKNCKPISMNNPLASYLRDNSKKSLKFAIENKKLDLDHFDFKAEITKMKNLPLDYLVNSPLEEFDDKIFMALWMGLLSDLTEESMLSSIKILFLKISSKIKKRIYSSKPEFLLGIYFAADEFKSFLSTNNVVIDWNAPNKDDHLKIIDSWLIFSNNLQENDNSRIAYKHELPIQSTGITRNRISHRSTISLPDASSSLIKQDLLPIYPKDIVKICDGSESTRMAFLHKFMRSKPIYQEGRLLDKYSNSLAEIILNELPLAKELFDAYSDSVDIEQIAWNLVNPLKIDISLILNSFLKELNDHKSELITNSAKLKKNLETFANTTPLDHKKQLTLAELQHSIEKKVDVFSYQKSPITVEELAGYLLGRNQSELNKRNPFLSHQDATTIFKHLIEWLLVETELEIYSKADNEIQEILKSMNEDPGFIVTPSLHHIGSLLNTVRHYNVLEKPHYLAFEYFAKLILRKQQVEKIEQSLTSPHSHQVMKLMMGEGKTKVILPLISKLLADGQQLPVIIAPYALYEEYIKNLRAVSEVQLQQSLYTFTFNRSSSTSIKDSKLILRMLKKAIEEKGVLLLTTETIRSLFLKYQELLILEEEFTTNSTGSTDDISQRRILIGKIITLIRDHSFALMDEGHLVLKSLTEMNFTLSSNDPLKENEIKNLLKIYTELLNLNFNFSKPLDLNISKDESDCFSAERNLLINRLYPNSNDADIRSYLKGTHEGYYEQVLHWNAELAAELALMKDQLWKLLPFTLSKSLNHRYGRNLNNPTIEYAIPYIGAQKPSPLSEFGHKFVMINYTIQMHIQEGLTKFQFKNWIHKLKKRWIQLVVKSSEEEANSFIEKHIGNYSLKQVNLNEESVINNLYNTFGKKREVIFDYLQDILLPNLNFHSKKLNSNEQDLGDFFFPQVIALSGTPYNSKTYPELFQADQINENEAISDDDDEEIFKTPKKQIELTCEEKKLVYALSLPVNKNFSVVEIESSESALLAIRENAKVEPNLSAFVDLGAYFKDYSNLKVAQMIMETLNEIEGVVFFDDSNSKLTCLKRGSDTPELYVQGKIPLNKLFAFFDNIHTFAADITLHENAHAIISFNQETCHYELLQAAKRMRKLEKSQSVSFLISKSIKQRIKSLIAPHKFDTAALYLYAIINEAKVLGKEIEMSITHQLKHQVKKTYLMKQLRSEKNLGFASQILIENNNFIPSGYFSKKITPKDYFEGYCRNLGQNLGQLTPPTLRWKSIIERCHKLLPKAIDSEGAGDLNREIEKQEERKVEIFVDSSNTFESALEDSSIVQVFFNPPFPSDFASTLNNPLVPFTTYNLNDFVSLIENKPVHIFDSNIFITRNFAKTAEHLMPNWQIPIKPVDYFLHLIYPQNNMYWSYYLIITLDEMKNIKSLLQNFYGLFPGMNRCYTSLYSIQGDLIAGDNVTDPNNPELKRMQIQLKYFDGREDFTRNEEFLLRNWIQGKEHVLTDLFSKLHQNREKIEDYGNGMLFKLINECAEIQKIQLKTYLEGQNRMETNNGANRKRKEPEPEVVEYDMDVDTDEPKTKKHKFIKE